MNFVWKAWPGKKRGIGLMSVLGALSMLSIFTAAILASTVRTLKAVTDVEKSDKARYAAYSGIQSALSRLNTPGQAGWSRILQTRPPGSTLPADEDLMQVTFRLEDGVTKDPDLQAIVGVYNNTDFCPAPYRSAFGPDGVTPLPPGNLMVCSTGLARDKTRIELTTVGASIKASGYLFNKAVYTVGNTSVLTGSNVTSFDSGTTDSTGFGADFTYVPYDPDTGPKLSDIGTQMDVVPPAVLPADAALEVDGTSKVDGNAENPGANTSNFNGATPANLKGNVVDNSGKVIPSTFDPSSALTLNTVPAVIQVNSGETYRLVGDLVLTGRQILINPPGSGPVRPVAIYVTGQIDLDNCTINMVGPLQGKRPSLLQFYLEDLGTPPSPLPLRAKIKDTTGSFVLAGKHVRAEVENSTIYGALMVGQCKLFNNSQLRFDVRLKDRAIGNSDLTVSNMFTGSNEAPATVEAIASSPATYPPPAAAGAGCGCGCGCLLAEVQCL